MSGKKFDLKKLIQYKRKQLDCMPPDSDLNVGFPVDWDEFNKMFFSKRNVIVEYPHHAEYSSLRLMGFYAGLKLAKEYRSIGICNYGPRNGFPHTTDFARSLSSKAGGNNILYMHDTLPENPQLADEWILNANWTPKVSYPSTADSDGKEILAEIAKSNGFNYPEVENSDSRIIVGWEGKIKRPNTKYVIAWDDRGKEELEKLEDEYSDQFVVIHYTEEKRLVDNWFARNPTMVDPGFDIQLMNPGINPRRVLLYAATNHLYDFRNFARVLPAVVKEFMSSKELKELM